MDVGTEYSDSELVQEWQDNVHEKWMLMEDNDSESLDMRKLMSEVVYHYQWNEWTRKEANYYQMKKKAMKKWKMKHLELNIQNEKIKTMDVKDLGDEQTEETKQWKTREMRWVKGGSERKQKKGEMQMEQDKGEETKVKTTIN
jgi:hypothetical protein